MATLETSRGMKPVPQKPFAADEVRQFSMAVDSLVCGAEMVIHQAEAAAKDKRQIQCARLDIDTWKQRHGGGARLVINPRFMEFLLLIRQTPGQTLKADWGFPPTENDGFAAPILTAHQAGMHLVSLVAMWAGAKLNDLKSLHVILRTMPKPAAIRAALQIEREKTLCLVNERPEMTTPETKPPPAPVAIVTRQPPQIAIGSKAYALSNEQALYLYELLNAGEWMSDSDFRVRCPQVGEAARPDRWRNALPSEVKAHLTTDRRKGTRWLA